MNEAQANTLVRVLRQLRAAPSAERARQIAAEGLEQLRRLRQPGDASDGHHTFARLVREVCGFRLHVLHMQAQRAPSSANDGGAPRRIGLTERESEVLEWVAAGKRDAEIAAILGISKKTVSKHVEHLLSKLHVETRTAAVNATRERAHPVASRRRSVA